MMLGKKFPMCMRALRIVVELIISPVCATVASYEELIEELENRAAKSKTSKLWLDCLIKPVFLKMSYVRAEREGDWPLHIFCVRSMLPYFFAAGHHHYARSSLIYLRTMENLPSDVYQRFLKGEYHLSPR